MIGRPSYILGLIFLVVLAAPTLFTPKDTVQSEAYYMPVSLTVDTSWVSCGDWNGMYYQVFDLILLCNENLKLGVPAARFIYLHELGHAFTFGYDIDYARWRGNYEAAADEFAAVQSVVRHHEEDLLAMANVFDEAAKDHPVVKDDPHPPLAKRAAYLRALYWSHFLGVGPVGAAWRDAFSYWKGQIAAAEPEAN